MMRPDDGGLGISVIRHATEGAVRRSTERQWSVDDIDWALIQPERLTDDDRSVVAFITYIEDHIPAYLSFFLRSFPTTSADAEIEDLCFNREYFRFLIAWAYDEERHASALTKYQIEAGIKDPEVLLRDLAQEQRKTFSLPYEDPIQAFTYTLVQEKATQLFYQRFKNVSDEPVLRALLSLLARDEARHFAFYGELVSAYVKRHGLKATVPHLKHVLENFTMPMADTLPGYRRWSIRVADHVGYDHTEAYECLGRLVKDFVGERGDSSAEDLVCLLRRIRAL